MRATPTFLFVTLAAACAPHDPAAPGRGPQPAPTPAVLVGAGDIAGCETESDEATAKLLDGIPGTVFTLGDNAYPRGSAQEFERCYTPTWGRHKARTRPVPGNHDWLTPDAAGYRAFFGIAGGAPTWYSFDAGAWHVIVLDSNCSKVGGCDPSSPQWKWLEADLAASRARCTLALWHHPRWGGGRPDVSVQPLWELLHRAGADLVVNGHDHFYERLMPLDAEGKPDPARGIRQITAGTGGISLYEFANPPLEVTEVRDAATYGVLKLTLHADRYEWAFIPVEGGTFTDAGSAACHD